GTTMGRTNQASHWSTTTSTPGHSRSGFCTAGTYIGAVVIPDPTLPMSRLFFSALVRRGLEFRPSGRARDKRTKKADRIPDCQSAAKSLGTLTPCDCTRCTLLTVSQVERV